MKVLKTLLRLKFYAALVGAGYLMHSCVSNDSRYRVRRVESKPYLLDTVTNHTLEIKTESFQVGSTEYRLRGLLREYDLQSTIGAIEQEMEEKK